MELIDQIIKEFFEELNQDTNIPKSFIVELKNLWENEKLKSEKSVIASIKKVSGVRDKN